MISLKHMSKHCFSLFVTLWMTITLQFILILFIVFVYSAFIFYSQKSIFINYIIRVANTVTKINEHN